MWYSIKSALKAFFGGGSTYFYLLIGGVIVGLYGYINFLESRLDTVKAERDAAVRLANSNGSIADSHIRIASKEAINRKEAEDAKQDLSKSVNPVDYAFEWVRERREAERNSNK